MLAAYTYQSGLRAPALIAFVKDILIYLVIIVAIIYIPTKLGGWEAIFGAAEKKFAGTPSATDGILLNTANQWQYITLKVLQEEPGSVSGPGADGPTECLVVDCLAAFDAVAREIGKSFRDSVVDLRARVVSGCVLSMARRRRHDGRFEVIGYEIAERGIFSALGRRMPVADDVIFSHYVEVLPAFRGQRIHRLLFWTRDAYFRQRGGRVVCGVCEPHNRASLQALHRDGAIIVGVVERITVLRVFVMAYTPFDRIAHLLY